MMSQHVEGMPTDIVDAYMKVLAWCRSQDEVAAMALAVGIMTTHWRVHAAGVYDKLGKQLVHTMADLSVLKRDADADVVHMLSHCIGAWFAIAERDEARRKSHTESN